MGKRGPAFARQLIERLHAVGQKTLRERDMRVVGKRLAKGERAMVEGPVHLAELAFATLDANVDDVCRGENLNLAGCNFDRSEAAGHRPRLLDRRIGFGFERPWREDGYVSAWQAISNQFFSQVVEESRQRVWNVNYQGEEVDPLRPVCTESHVISTMVQVWRRVDIRPLVY